MKKWGKKLSFTTIKVAINPAKIADVKSDMLPRTRSCDEEVQKLKLSNKISSEIVV